MPIVAITETPYPPLRVRAPAPAAELPYEIAPAAKKYEVGYGKPPEHSRFKPGRSGNPHGRPKGAKGMNTMVRSLLTEKVTVRTPTGPKRMVKMEAILHKLAEKAFAGDTRAQATLIQMYRTSVPDEVAQGGSGGSAAILCPEQEESALAAFREMLLAELLEKEEAGGGDE